MCNGKNNKMISQEKLTCAAKCRTLLNILFASSCFLFFCNCLQYAFPKGKMDFLFCFVFWRLFKGVLLLSWEIDLVATWSERMSRCHNVPCSVVPKAVVKSSRLQCFVRMDCIFHSYYADTATFRHSLFLKSAMNTEKLVSYFSFIYDKLILLQKQF